MNTKIATTAAVSRTPLLPAAILVALGITLTGCGYDSKEDCMQQRLPDSATKFNYAATLDYCKRYAD